MKLSSSSKWKRLRGFMASPWSYDDDLLSASIEGLQSFMKESPLKARGRATFWVLGRLLHGIKKEFLEAFFMAPWKDMKRRR